MHTLLTIFDKTEMIVKSLRMRFEYFFMFDLICRPLTFTERATSFYIQKSQKGILVQLSAPPSVVAIKMNVSASKASC